MCICVCVCTFPFLVIIQYFRELFSSSFLQSGKRWSAFLHCKRKPSRMDGILLLQTKNTYEIGMRREDVGWEVIKLYPARRCKCHFFSFNYKQSGHSFFITDWKIFMLLQSWKIEIGDKQKIASSKLQFHCIPIPMVHESFCSFRSQTRNHHEATRQADIISPTSLQLPNNLHETLGSTQIHRIWKEQCWNGSGNE